MQIIQDRQKCTGCGACNNACPADAICMKQNEYGFWIPVVDGKKCMNCSICRKICPSNSFELQKNNFYKSYAMYAENEDEVRQSSSGGIFFSMSKYIIDKLNGVVFGAVFNEQLQVEIVSADCVEDLSKMTGSKYVHSNTKYAFREVQSHLEIGKYVLYSGLPCQIAGLLNFLKKDYDKLITVEILCHGVPSQGLFHKYIEELEEKYGSSVKHIAHRDGRTDWTPLVQKNILIEFENGNQIKCGEDRDLYMSLYVRELGYNVACYGCSYASPNRTADITLGDYGGLGVIYKFDKINKSGVSFVRVNNKKAERFIYMIKGLYMEQRPNHEIEIMNTAITRAVKMTAGQKTFMEDYKKLKRRKLFEKYYYKNYGYRLKAALKNAGIWILSPKLTAKLLCCFKMEKRNRFIHKKLRKGIDL